MNRVCLIGRLTAKPELRYTNSNIPVTKFTIAVNRIFSNAQGQKETDFINIIVWRKPAENIVNYLDKGSKVSIEGRIQSGSYTAKDGSKHYTTDIVADSVQFLDNKSKNTQTVTPYDYQDTEETEDTDPFAEFGEQVSIDDNFLE